MFPLRMCCGSDRGLSFCMKTNVIMTRKMGGFDVLQRTQDGFFDANALLAQWNADKRRPRRRMAEFFENDNVIFFVVELEKELGLSKTQLTENHQRPKIDIGDTQLVSIIRGRRNKRGLKEPDKYYMHPYLFIKFAMWLNPKFEVQVIKFVYDELIKHRKIAGDNYRLLTAAVSIFPDVDYRKIAQGLNYIIFNQHYPNIRNNATTAQLLELHELESKLCFAIDMGLIRNYPELIETMRRIYDKKYIRF